jgi:hypothetical protein
VYVTNGEVPRVYNQYISDISVSVTSGEVPRVYNQYISDISVKFDVVVHTEPLIENVMVQKLLAANHAAY